CALATCGASTATSSTAARQTVLRRAAPFGASIVVMLAASDFEVPPPLAGDADSRWRRVPQCGCRVNRGIRPVKRKAAEALAISPMGEWGKVANYHEALRGGATACARRR